MKLELKHLAPYLPYKLKMKGNQGGDVFHLLGLRNNETCLFFELSYWEDIFDFKPMLRPICDLTKEIEINGKKFVPMEYLFDFENPYNKIPKRMKYHYEEVPNRISITHNATCRSTEVLFSEMGANPYWMMQKLFEWHFDVFGLINEGLALPLI